MGDIGTNENELNQTSEKYIVSIERDALELTARESLVANRSLPSLPMKTTTMMTTTTAPPSPVPRLPFQQPWRHVLPLQPPLLPRRPPRLCALRVGVSPFDVRVRGRSSCTR